LVLPATALTGLWLCATRHAPRPCEGKMLASLFNGLRCPDERVKRAAAEQLRAIGPVAYPGLRDAARDSDFEVRAEALLALSALPGSARPFLLAALNDPQPYVRMRAAELLGKYAQTKAGFAAAVRRLSALLDDSQEPIWVRCAAAEALAAFGSEAQDALPALLRALRHPDPDLRAYSVWALESVGCDNRAQAPLVRRLRDAEYEVRAGAADALALYGKAAVGPLAKVLDNPACGIVPEATAALARIGGDGLTVLRTCATSKRNATRIAVAYALRFAMPPDLDLLRKLGSDPDSEVRSASEASRHILLRKAAEQSAKRNTFLLYTAAMGLGLALMFLSVRDRRAQAP